MIPKGGGTNFRGIGLVEVLCKEISDIINFQILSSIQFRYALHGFCTGIETRTVTLEENLLQNLIAVRETVLHSIFLYLCKGYNALYRDRCLDILAGM